MESLFFAGGVDAHLTNFHGVFRFLIKYACVLFYRVFSSGEAGPYREKFSELAVFICDA